MSSQDSDETIADIVDSSSPSILSRDILPFDSLQLAAISSRPADFPPVSPLQLLGSRQEEEQPLAVVSSLIWIQREQEYVEKKLQVTNSCSSSVGQLKERLLAIEGSLKQVSYGNQRERKEIATLLCGNAASQGKALKEKLLDLAQRQRDLLSCFKKQNELTKLCNSVTMETNIHVALETVTMETNNRVAMDSNPVAMETDSTITQRSSEAVSRTVVPERSDNRHIVIPEPLSTGSQQVNTVTRTDIEVNLFQPVPLDVLINHSFLIPGEKMSCTLLGCHFEAVLSTDGQLVDSEKNKKYSSLQVWLGTCWSALGHQKRLNKRQVYRTVMYRNQPLITVCEDYSRKQSSYQQKRQQECLQSSMPTNTYQPLQQMSSLTTVAEPGSIVHDHSALTMQSTASTERVIFDLDKFLKNCLIIPHHKSASLTLPHNFWGNWSFAALSPSLYHQLDNWTTQ